MNEETKCTNPNELFLAFATRIYKFSKAVKAKFAKATLSNGRFTRSYCVT